MLGYNLPKDAAEDSIDIMPILKGKSNQGHETLVYNSPHGFAMRKKNWVLTGVKADGPHKGKLFNLEKDIAQKRDLAAKYPKKVEELTILFRKIFNS